MTRKDFELIGGVIRAAIRAGEATPLVAEALANSLTATNPSFNRKRFLAACGIGSDHVTR